MVDHTAVRAANALGLQRLLDSRGELGQRLQVVAGDALRVFGDQEEPVAAPGHIASDGTVTGHVHRQPVVQAKSGHVAHADRAVFVQRGADRADGGFDAMYTGLDTAQVGE